MRRCADLYAVEDRGIVTVRLSPCGVLTVEICGELDRPFAFNKKAGGWRQYLLTTSAAASVAATSLPPPGTAAAAA